MNWRIVSILMGLAALSAVLIASYFRGKFWAVIILLLAAGIAFMGWVLSQRRFLLASIMAFLLGVLVVLILLVLFGVL